MFAVLAQFSLVEVVDRAGHRAHLERELLECRPEALRSPAVAWGEHWVHAPDCRAAGSGGDPALGGVHYAALYWFRAPAERGLRDVHDARRRAVQRGGAGPAVRERFAHRFVPLKGYVAPRALVSAEALPFRPHRGVFAALSRFARRDAEVEDTFGWYDRIRLPDLLACRGAAGAWTFASAELFRPDRDLAQPALRLHLVYLDEDPLEFVADLAARAPAWRRAGRARDTSAVEETVFAAPLRAIVPWRWTWFDGAGA